MLLAALATAAVLQAAPPPSADETAVRLAGGAFAFGCLQRLSAVGSAAEYAAGADELGRGLKAQAPDVTTAAMSGIDGRTCRVTYHGPGADLLWRGFTDISTAKTGDACTEAPATPGRKALSCAATAQTPAYDVAVRREGDAVTADMTWRAPPTR